MSGVSSGISMSNVTTPRLLVSFDVNIVGSICVYGKLLIFVFVESPNKSGSISCKSLIVAGTTKLNTSPGPCVFVSIIL